jgi:glycyl-tRNA synthetase beta chain
MHNFLLEILCEEIPSDMQNYAVSNFGQLFLKYFIKPLGISADNLKVMVTPRRIAVIISNIDEENFSLNSDLKGPKASIDKEILEKFLFSHKKTEDDLYIKQINGEKYYFIKNSESGHSIRNVLKNFVEKILYDYKWPQAMYWGDYKVKWIRPIRNILCMIDDEIIPIKFHHYNSNNKTFGNRILAANNEITIQNVNEYVNQLHDNYIILDQQQRRDIIIQQIKDIEKTKYVKTKIDEKLLDEVIGLVEWPYAILGRFKKEFLSLPEQLIITVIQKHQKCFPVFSENKITNHFIVIANFKNGSVISGYEKVISARLYDATSVVEHDRKLTLQQYVEKLDKITFHKKLGTFREKCQRIISLSKFIAIWVPNASIINVEKSASLCKADLATSIVKEFPELAGLMGAYYLSSTGKENNEILSAIREHYLPINAGDKCPVEPVTVTISIADKIDNLVGLIAAGEKINSEKDPLGLRRNAIAIIRTTLENKINLPLKVIIMKAIDLYPASLFVSIVQKITFKVDEEKQKKDEVIQTILDFLHERFKHILNKKGVDFKIFDTALDDLDHPLIVEQKCNDLAYFLKRKEAEEFLASLKRAVNILTKNNELKLKPKYKSKLFIENEEVKLAEIAETISEDIKELLKNNNFESALNALLELTIPLNQFMDNVMINCEAIDIRKNRFGLLVFVINVTEEVARFQYYLK